jgi:hypothetical protein
MRCRSEEAYKFWFCLFKISPVTSPISMSCIEVGAIVGCWLLVEVVARCWNEVVRYPGCCFDQMID